MCNDFCYFSTWDCWGRRFGELYIFSGHTKARPVLKGVFEVINATMNVKRVKLESKSFKALTIVNIFLGLEFLAQIKKIYDFVLWWIANESRKTSTSHNVKNKSLTSDLRSRIPLVLFERLWNSWRCLSPLRLMMFCYTKTHFGVKYAYDFNFLFDTCAWFFSIMILFYFFLWLVKKAFAFYDSTIFELNIVINVDPNTIEPLLIFVDYIKSLRVTYWQMFFFFFFPLMFKSDW